MKIKYYNNKTKKIDEKDFEISDKDLSIVKKYNDVWNKNNTIEFVKKRTNYIIQKFGEDFFRGKKILELGAHYGDISNEFKKLEADVLCVEGRYVNETMTPRQSLGGVANGPSSMWVENFLQDKCKVEVVKDSLLNYKSDKTPSFNMKYDWEEGENINGITRRMYICEKNTILIQ